MTDVSIAQLAPRQDIYRTPTGAGGKVVIRRSLPLPEQLYNMSGLRKLFLLVALAIVWEVYARYVDNELLFPTFSSTIEAMVTNLANGVLISRVWVSLRILLMGYGLGIGIATVLTCLARWASVSAPISLKSSPRCSIRCRRSRCYRSR
jgi:NitT/TauT family transport system permease protein